MQSRGEAGAGEAGAGGACWARGEGGALTAALGQLQARAGGAAAGPGTICVGKYKINEISTFEHRCR